MYGTIARQTITIHPTREGAEKLPVANQKMDEDWTYEVTEREDGRFIVVVKIEDGEFVSTL